MSPSTSTPPAVSAVIPCFNGLRYLEQCLQSLGGLERSGVPYEAVVVDDGSSEDIRATAERFGPRVRYIWQPNQGPGAARNTGIRESRSDCVWFLDSDDYLLSPDALKRQLEVLERHLDVGLVYAQAMKVDVNSRPIGFRRPTFARDDYVHSGDSEIKQLLFYNHITTSTVIVRRAALDRAGHFRTDLPSTQDRDLWLRIARVSRVGYVDQATVAYRVHEAGITGRKTLDRWLRTHQEILDSLYGDPEFAQRFAALRAPAYANLELRAAFTAYRKSDLGPALRYASRSLLRAATAHRWQQCAQCLVLLGKIALPGPLRQALRRVSRETRVVAASTRVKLSQPHAH